MFTHFKIALFFVLNAPAYKILSNTVVSREREEVTSQDLGVHVFSFTRGAAHSICFAIAHLYFSQNKDGNLNVKRVATRVTRVQ